MPYPICAQCKQVVIPANSGAVVSIQRIGERETKRLVCLSCADRIVEAMRERALTMAADSN